MALEKHDEESMMVLNLLPKKEDHQFISEIVHEIRNPLTIVKGFLQLIKPYLKEIGKEQYADVALTELNRAHLLIVDFLQGSKTLSDSTQNIPLNKVIHDLALLYESEAILKNIQITTSLSNQDAILKIPENKLKQVLMNLINNAIEAIDENSASNRKITITTQIEAPLASIKITDSYGGISSETLDSLFIPYYSSKKTGTGIGLCICKNIIEEYEGSIHVESFYGKQTTFTIYFPI